MNFCRFYARFTTLRALCARKTKFSILTICYGIASTCMKKKNRLKRLKTDGDMILADFTRVLRLYARFARVNLKMK